MNNNEHNPQLLYTIDEAAQVLSVSRMTVYNLMNAGKLGSVKMGAAKKAGRRITRAQLEAYVASLT